MTLLGVPSRYVALYGIEQNHLNVVYKQFYAPREWDTSVAYSYIGPQLPNVIDSLYSSAGQQVSFLWVCFHHAHHVSVFAPHR